MTPDTPDPAARAACLKARPTYFRQFFDATSTAMSYLIADSATGTAAAIDPTPDPCQSLVLKALLAERGLALRLVLLTHTHGEAADDYAEH